MADSEDVSRLVVKFQVETDIGGNTGCVRIKWRATLIRNK